MKNFRTCLGLAMTLVLGSVWLAPAADTTQAPAKKVRVLVVTGGHGFEREPFFKLFKDNPEITFAAAEHPKAHGLWKADAAKDWDVLVLYDMWQDITEEAKADFVNRLKEGKGLVVMHHALASYQQWPEYRKIVGGRYFLKAMVVDGKEKPPSAYKEGLHFRIHVADPKHPITRGVSDWEAHDEAYKSFDVGEDCHPLLTTEEPESTPTIAWCKTYEAARVVCIQSGHDHFAYENPNFQRILRQAIRWTARKD